MIRRNDYRRNSVASSGERPQSIEAVAKEVSIGHKLSINEEYYDKIDSRKEITLDRTISPISRNDDTMPLSLSLTMAQELLGQLNTSPIRTH